MSDFLRNHKSHVERIKKTRVPEVLTVNGRAEVVILDTESYENLMERLHHMEAVASVRAEIVRSGNSAAPREEASEAEIERSQAVMKEIMAETERLGLYK